jgi:hypothetical protein
MILLDFKMSPMSAADERQYAPESADPAAVESTYFIAPVRFTIDGTELFELPHDAGNPWLLLPVVGIAGVLGGIVRRLRGGETIMYSIPGTGRLHLSRRGDVVSITCDVNDRTCSVPLAELVAAFDGFRTRVRRLLVEAIPSMQQHASWTEWFPGESDV